MQVTTLWRSDKDRESAAEPVPGAVGDNVGRVGDQRSVVCDELARLVSSMVVVRVTDGREGAVGHALHATIHLERARHFVDHPSSRTWTPHPAWTDRVQGTHPNQQHDSID